MEFAKVVRRRRMIRNFSEEPVPAGVLERILDIGRRGPSAGFSQGFDFLVLTEPEDRERFWSQVGGDGYRGVRRAPVLIVPLASKDAYLNRYAEPDKGWTDRDEARWPVPYWYIDTGMAALLMLLAAVDEGLGALLFGIPPEDTPTFRDSFGVPDSYDPIGVVAIGHRAAGEQPPSSAVSRRRRDPGRQIHRGRW